MVQVYHTALATSCLFVSCPCRAVLGVAQHFTSLRWAYSRAHTHTPITDFTLCVVWYVRQEPCLGYNFSSSHPTQTEALAKETPEVSPTLKKWRKGRLKVVWDISVLRNRFQLHRRSFGRRWLLPMKRHRCWGSLDYPKKIGKSSNSLFVVPPKVVVFNLVKLKNKCLVAVMVYLIYIICFQYPLWSLLHIWILKSHHLLTKMKIKTTLEKYIVILN